MGVKRLLRYVFLGSLVAGFSAGAGPGGSRLAGAEPGASWVIYTNELSWLRVGTRMEFDKPQQKYKEIWGGRSKDPLKKTLVKGGFRSRTKALRVLCGQLSRVRLKYHGLATPKWTTNALFKGREYNLRLSSGAAGAPRRGMEYDLEAEVKALQASGGVTPRIVFAPQFLCHNIEMSTVRGPKKLDEWTCQPVRPDSAGRYRLPDGYGGRRTYTCDIFRGPFLDSYTLARALKTHDVSSVKLWPPNRKMEVYASDVPTNARDYGIHTESVQPHIVDPRMLEWVVYATKRGWLRIGTKTEFERPRPHSQEIWAGRSAEPIAKERVLKDTFNTYEQAARALCAVMTKVKWRYVHNNRPNWIPLGTVKGKEYHLQLARDPELLIVSGIGYDANAERLLLARFGITPRLSCGDQYIVHSVQMSTYSGPRKTNRWMMVVGKPKEGHVRVPDGLGGTFTHKTDASAGPFKDSYDLSRFLKTRKIDAIALAGSRIRVQASWVPENPKDHGERARATKPKLTKVVPDKGTQGEMLYVTLFGKEIEYGAEIDLGEGIQAYRLTYFGRDPQSEDEQWLLSLSIAGDADVGKHDVRVANYDSRRTMGKGLFEVVPAVDPQCPPIDLPHVAGNPKAAAAKARQRKALEALDEARAGLHDWEIKLTTEEQTARKTGTRQSDDVRIRLALMQHRRIDALVAIEKTSVSIRKAEADWIKSLKGVGSGIPNNARRTLIEQCRDRSDCLRTEMFKRLEELKKVDRVLIMALDPEAGKRYQKYATSRNDLDATLKFTGLLLKVENEVARLARRTARRTGQGLDAAQQALYRSYVHHAEWALDAIEIKGITAMEAQKHYLYAMQAMRDKGKKTPWMESWLGDAAQVVASGTSYVLAFGNVAWTAFSDGFKHMLPDDLLDWTGIETQAQKMDAAILKARNDADQKRAYVRGLLQYARASARSARRALARPAGSSIVSQGYSLLMADRPFHELTDGGIFRILGAYDVDRTDHLETELLAAIHHGRLSVRDMQRSLNIEMGRVPETGDFTFKILLDPLRVARVVKADEAGLLAEKRVFIDGKRAQVEREMAQLLPRWRKAKYDFDRIAEFLPQNYQHHNDLLWNSEDYCQFVIRLRMFDHEEALDVLRTLAQKTGDPHMHRALESLRMASTSRLSLELRPYLARTFQLQAQTKIICRDYIGAAGAMEQAFKTSPKLKRKFDPDAVKDALLWEDVRERALDTFHQLGNQGFMLALSAKIMQLVGPAAAAKPMSATEFLWGQLNPFAEVMTAEGAKNVIENLGEQLAQEVVGKALEKHVGVDKAYADWAAGLLIGLANKWGQELGARGVERLRQSRLYRSAVDMKRASKALAEKRPDTEPDVAGAREKGDLAERVSDLTVVAAAEMERQDAEAAFRSAAAKHGAESKQAEAARDRVITANADLDGRTRLLTDRTVLGALSKYDIKTRRGFSLKHALRLFRRLPLGKLRALKRSGKLTVDAERRVDTVRIQMMDALQKDVVRWSNGDVICLVITGAAANPKGPEYVKKMLDSDFDFTFLTRADLPDSRLAEIEARYLDLVAAATGRSPLELADSTGFCDKLHAGYDMEKLADITEANVGNPERYLNLGSTEFVTFMNKVAGRLKAFNKETGAWETLSLEANEKIFGHMKFETWMGADIALEQFRFREAHREHRGADVLGFLKDQGKYTVRVALGKILSDPKGCARINALKAKETVAAGGLHAAIIKVAREFEGRLFTRQQITLLRQCNELKKGARPEAVFRVSGEDALNKVIRKHNREASAFFDEALPVTMKSQQETLRGLESDTSSAADREQAMKIVLAQAWALSRLEQRHRDHLAGLSGAGQSFATSLAALELAKLYRRLVPPKDEEGRHEPEPELPQAVGR